MQSSDWPETHLFVFVLVLLLVLEMKGKFEDEEDCFPPVSSQPRSRRHSIETEMPHAKSAKDAKDPGAIRTDRRFTEQLVKDWPRAKSAACCFAALATFA